MALLELSELTRQVPLPDGSELRILKGVNLTAQPGDHISIVGRSGTGKSTLLNLIGMLDVPNSGTYYLDGIDTVALSESKRAALRGERFGFVFQQFNIFPTRTALENVEVPLLYTGDRRFFRRHELAADMLDRVGLGDRLDSYPAQMSGGEQQRIAIARALVRRPSVILADEPTGALDPETGQSVMDLLEEVARESHSALIVISHDMKVAQRAQRVYTLADGVLHDVNVFADDESRIITRTEELSEGGTRTPGSPRSGNLIREADRAGDSQGAGDSHSQGGSAPDSESAPATADQAPEVPEAATQASEKAPEATSEEAPADAPQAPDQAPEQSSEDAPHARKGRLARLVTRKGK